MRKLIFIGGMHRSGTSVLHRCIRSHAAVSGFRDTGRPEDEGQYQQSVYPQEEYGGGGTFAFGYSEVTRLTEASALVTPENRARLLSEWGEKLDPEKPFWVEKTPSNLVRSRFLQALVPHSAFVFIVRHPAASCLATKKWTLLPVLDILEHWAHCHEILREDAKFLREVYFVRYERFAARPQAHLDVLFHRLGLTPHSSPETVEPVNQEHYLSSWRTTRAQLLAEPASYPRLAAVEARVRVTGYSLRDDEPSELPAAFPFLDP